MKNNFLWKLLILFVALFFFCCAGLTILTLSFSTIQTSQTLKLEEESNKDIQGSVTKNSEKQWMRQLEMGAQYDGVLKNNTPSEISKWKVTIKIPEKSYIDSSWNGEYTVADGQIIILPPPDYNQIIPPNGSITFGFIMYSPPSFKADDVTVEYYITKKVTELTFFKLLYYSAIVLLIIIFVYIIFMFKLRAMQKKHEYDRQFIEQTLKLFANTIEAKDVYTRGHSVRVSIYTKEIAKRLGLPEEDQMNIYYISLLHDVGKIGIKDSILTKPGKLDSDEYAIMKSHVIKSGEILSDFISLPGASEIVRHHHERYDGDGYPDKLKGDCIPLFSRIICIADSFDAMTSDRCYRKQLTKEEVIDELKKNSGTQFDPQLVPILLDMIECGVAPVELKN